MPQTKNLIKDFRANSSEASSQSANSSVTYAQIAKELNDYFEGKIAFWFSNCKRKQLLYTNFSINRSLNRIVPTESYSKILTSWEVGNKDILTVINTLNSDRLQRRLRELYDSVVKNPCAEISLKEPCAVKKAYSDGFNEALRIFMGKSNSSSNPTSISLTREFSSDGGESGRVKVEITPTIELFLDVQGISEITERAKSNKQKANISSTSIESPQVTEEFISSLVKMLNAEYGNKECSIMHVSYDNYICFVIYLCNNRSGVDKILTVLTKYATEYEVLKHINSEYFANRLSTAYKELFGKELKSESAKEALSAEDNLREEVMALRLSSESYKSLAGYVAKACNDYFKLKGMTSCSVSFIVPNTNRFRLNNSGISQYYSLEDVKHLLDKVIELTANKQPAKEVVSQELLALQQLANQLDSYFEGLVEVIVDESKLAISLKLDKLGGFQLDNFIYWSEDENLFEIVVNFYGKTKQLDNPFSDDCGLFGPDTYSLDFLTDLKYRAQSLKAE